MSIQKARQWLQVKPETSGEMFRVFVVTIWQWLTELVNLRISDHVSWLWQGVGAWVVGHQHQLVCICRGDYCDNKVVLELINVVILHRFLSNGIVVFRPAVGMLCIGCPIK